MPVKYQSMGPGNLVLGSVGTTIDISAQITEAVLTPSKDAEDNLNTLSGDVVPGDVTYTFALKGTVVQDWSETGINKFCLEHAGETMPFTFEPNNTSGPTLSGNLTIDPIDIGGKVKTKPTAEFEFSLVGKPTWTPGV